ncbi:MAG: 4Fe4S-binding leucine-rich repeat protein, partial [Acidithiobacillus ferriphilus]
MRMNDPDEAIDWQGCAISCDVCAEREIPDLKCEPLHACVHDRYAKRVDRFFRWNPQIAKDYLQHGYFEVRACAARYADIFHLPALMNDPDETVRWAVAQRLPQRYLLRMIHDPHREVRIRVATRLDDRNLSAMMHDADYYVRLEVARRLPKGLLPLMMHDADVEVRRVVAKRIGVDALVKMLQDDDPGVRLDAIER